MVFRLLDLGMRNTSCVGKTPHAWATKTRPSAKPRDLHTPINDVKNNE